MYDLVDIVLISCIAGTVSMFIGWMNGYTDGMNDERKRRDKIIQEMK